MDGITSADFRRLVQMVRELDFGLDPGKPRRFDSPEAAQMADRLREAHLRNDTANMEYMAMRRLAGR